MPHLAELVASAKAAVEDAQDVAALDLVRVEYFGKKGHFTLQMQSLRDVPAEDRPAAGAVINQAKQEVQDALKPISRGEQRLRAGDGLDCAVGADLRPDVIPWARRLRRASYPSFTHPFAINRRHAGRYL